MTARDDYPFLRNLVTPTMERALDEIDRLRAERDALKATCGVTRGPYVCTLPSNHDGDHVQQVAFASWAAAPSPSEPQP